MSKSFDINRKLERLRALRIELREQWIRYRVGFHARKGRGETESHSKERSMEPNLEQD